MSRQKRDQEWEAIMADLREVREACLRGEVDAEGRPTAFGRLVDGAQRVVAQTAALMAWNLAARFDGHNEATEAVRAATIEHA